MDGVILGPPLTPAPPAKSVTNLVLEKMHHFPQKAAQIDGLTGRTVSFQDLLNFSDKLAQALLQRQHPTDSAPQNPSPGPPGRRSFVIFCENRTEALVGILAVLQSRIPAFLFAWSDNEDDHDLGIDLETLCAGERPDLVLCSSACLAAVLAAAPKMPWLTEVLVAAPAGELLMGAPAMGGGLRVRSLDEYLGTIELGSVADGVDDDGATAFVLPPSRGAPEDSCTFLTFGHIGFAVRQMLAGDYSGGFGWTESDVVLAALPVCTAMGVGIAVGLLALGATQVLVTGSSARRLQIALHTQGVTQLLVAPEPARALARRATLVPTFTPGHLRGVLVIGDLSRADRSALLAWLPVVEVRTALLDLDTCCTQLLVPAVSAVWPDCRDAVGAPAPGVRAYIADVSTGCCLPAFCVGELLLKRDEDVDWRRTGSLAYYDHTRLFFLVNRLKSVVKGTFRHSPVEKD